MKDLLLVVDMQKVYLEGAPWACENTVETAEKISWLIDSGKCEHIIFTRFDAPQDPVGTWKEYNHAYREINENRMFGEIVEELREYTKEYPVYSKSAYSSLVIEEVKQAAQEADRVLLTGVVAECCILATLEGLIDMGIKVLYLPDAISGQNKESEEIILKIAEGFSTIHTEIITVEDYLKEEERVF